MIILISVVLTSKLWGSSLDGSQATSHSVAHPLQETKQQTQISENSLSANDKVKIYYAKISDYKR